MKVVIAGAGFGGLKLARQLNNKKGIDVLLIDRFNHHQFQPLFYQVATAGLDASNISFPLRKVFQKSRNVRVRMAIINKVDAGNKTIHTDKGLIQYDVLVVATGAGTNFFGNDQMALHALPMKSTTDALRIRNQLIENLEKAVTETDPEKQQQLMNIVVVGGGPTGVEVSGAIAEMRNYVLPKDFPELDFSTMNIHLVEGSSKVLAAMSEKSAAQAAEYLNRLGVILHTNTQVATYDGSLLTTKGQLQINTSTVIWAAGIKGYIPEGFESLSIQRGNRLEVDELNRVKGLEAVFAIGDVASMSTEKYPSGHPQVAPVAMQQAENLAKNLLKMNVRDIELTSFEYYDKGSMATVGRNLAVVDIPKPKLHFGGFLAWLVWMFLHLMLILGVKNRLFVFLNWMYNYLTYDQSLRLIFNPPQRVHSTEP